MGTAALIRVDARTFELAKMAVTERARGRGIGRALAEAAMRLAVELGADTLVLHTSTKLEAACRLYESLGFRYDPDGDDEVTRYRREVIRMVYSLKRSRPPRRGAR